MSSLWEAALSGKDVRRWQFFCRFTLRSLSPFNPVPFILLLLRVHNLMHLRPPPTLLSLFHTHRHAYTMHILFKTERSPETSLVVQGLRPMLPKQGGLDSTPGQGTRSHMPQLSILRGTTLRPSRAKLKKKKLHSPEPPSSLPFVPLPTPGSRS